MRVVRGAMNIDKDPRYFWLNFTTFRRFSPFHLFHCSSTINRAAGRRGYGHVSAPKGQATSLYRQHFSKSNDQTQMIPNLIVEQKIIVYNQKLYKLGCLHSIHLHLSHLSPFPGDPARSVKNCADLYLPLRCFTTTTRGRTRRRGLYLGSFFEPRFSCRCCVVGVVWRKWHKVTARLWSEDN